MVVIAFCLIYGFVYNIFIIANKINFPNRNYLLALLSVPWIFWLLGYRLQFKILEFFILYLSLLLVCSLIIRMFPRKKLSKNIQILLVGIALLYSIIFFSIGGVILVWGMGEYFDKPKIFSLKGDYYLNAKFIMGDDNNGLGIELSKQFSDSIIYQQVDKSYLYVAKVDELIIVDNVSAGTVKVSHNQKEIVLRK